MAAHAPLFTVRTGRHAAGALADFSPDLAHVRRQFTTTCSTLDSLGAKKRQRDPRALTT